MRASLALMVAIGSIAACAAHPGTEIAPRGEGPGASTPAPSEAISRPYTSTYKADPAPAMALVGATILDGAGNRIEKATLVVRDGKIAAIGSNITVPEDAVVIDALGKWVTPGIVDAHSHLGSYPVPYTDANNDGNEITDPNTADVWVEHSIFPQDPAFDGARAGGVTTLQVLPGSTNLFGGRTVVLKNVPSATVQGMKFPGAPQGLKMACGENPKVVYGARGRSPASRMKSYALYRAAWSRAEQYKRKREVSGTADGNNPAAPPKDFELETLASALADEIDVYMHCYRADELAQAIDLAKEFGFRIASFEHAVEAYKIIPLIVEHEICISSSPDLWGYKMEAYDGIRENLAIVHDAGGCAIIHSDSPVNIQHLNQEAAKVLFAGQRAGLSITKAEAWSWLSLNPARSLGIDEGTGSLEPGKAADIALWSADPFSVYAKAEKVFIDGALVFDRDEEALKRRSDFYLGKQSAMSTAE